MVSVPQESLVRIQIFDIRGNKVVSYQERMVGNKRVSLESLPQGYYIAHIANGNAKKSIPIAIR